MLKLLSLTTIVTLDISIAVIIGIITQIIILDQTIFSSDPKPLVGTVSLSSKEFITHPVYKTNSTRRSPTVV